MAPPRMMGDGRMAKDPKKTFTRLLRYLLQYKFHVLMVLVCIFAHALVQSRSAVMLTTSCPWWAAAPPILDRF